MNCFFLPLFCPLRTPAADFFHLPTGPEGRVFFIRPHRVMHCWMWVKTVSDSPPSPFPFQAGPCFRRMLFLNCHQGLFGSLFDEGFGRAPSPLKTLSKRSSFCLFFPFLTLHVVTFCWRASFPVSQTQNVSPVPHSLPPLRIEPSPKLFRD